MELDMNKEMTVLETFILMQLLVENLESLPAEINRQRVKQQTKTLISLLSPTVEKYYDKMFDIDSQSTIDICYEYSRLAKQIASLNIPDKIGLSQMLDAWRTDKKTIEATAHRIIKKS